MWYFPIKYHVIKDRAFGEKTLMAKWNNPRTFKSIL